jgi:hypothetical protein
MIFYRFFLACLLALCGFSCQYFEKNTWLAELDGDYLSLSEVQKAYEQAGKPIDSVQWVSTYVQNWVDRELLARVAAKNVNPDYVDLMTEAYKKDLQISLYYKDKLQEQLEKEIDEKEIYAFYQAHPKFFNLEAPLLKLFVLKVFNSDARAKQNTQDMLKAFVSNVEIDMLLETYELSGTPYYYNKNNLLSLAEIVLQSFPALRALQDKTMGKKSIVEIPSEGYVYYVYVVDFQDKGLAPFAVAKEKAQMLVIGQKKQELLQNLKNKLREDALKKQELRIHVQ